MILKSFKVCALTSAIDGSKDKDIHCLEEQELCHAGLKLLTQQLKLVSGPKDNHSGPDND